MRLFLQMMVEAALGKYDDLDDEWDDDWDNDCDDGDEDEDEDDQEVQAPAAGKGCRCRRGDSDCSRGV